MTEPITPAAGDGGEESIARLVKESGLLGLRQAARGERNAGGPRWIVDREARVYRRSLYFHGDVLFFIGVAGGEKALYLVRAQPFTSPFSGTRRQVGGLSLLKAPLSPENARCLHETFPFTAPVSLRTRKTTVGCGDRLGRATPGHIRAVENRDVHPVLAQQSIRELALTGRDYPGVVSDATFLVFQEGYERGYGADGDHLKTIKDIDVALAAGMPMITLDLTDVMSPEPALWSASRVEEEFEKLPQQARAMASRYADRTFAVGGAVVEFSGTEAQRCVLMYRRAPDFSLEVDRHLKAKRGERYDLEISIDETTAPTLPAHHLFIASELELRGVTPSSLAPRFIGEFQKGIDYIGDTSEFERQFAVHCAIAKAYGGYKISIHSGSDKFSVYPAIGTHTGMRLHLKTAGTSWLQAVRLMARVNPALFRLMLQKARESFAAASKLYHVTTDLTAIADAGGVADSLLEGYLDRKDSRQLLHITYGGLLGDGRIRAELFHTLTDNEELHYDLVGEHIGKHLRLLGVPPR